MGKKNRVFRFKSEITKCPLENLDDFKHKKGWRIGNMTFLISKSSKKSNRIRNLLVSEFKIKQHLFKKNKEIKINL